MKLGLVLVVLVGCGKSKEACKTDATELGRFLAEADDPTRLPDAPGLHLVSRPELPHASVMAAPVVIVMPAGFVYQGKPADAATLGAELEYARDRVRKDIQAGYVSRKHPPNPRGVIFEIDEAAPWSAVVAATAAATAAKLDQPVLVFSRPELRVPPPPSSADAELDRIEAGTGNGATKLAELVSSAIKGCKALEKEFSSVAGGDGEDKGQHLIAAIPPALIECGCDVDLPVLRTTMWRIVSNPHPATVIPLTLADDGEEIAAPAATPWSVVSKRFTASTKTVRLVIR